MSLAQAMTAAAMVNSPVVMQVRTRPAPRAPPVLTNLLSATSQYLQQKERSRMKKLTVVIITFGLALVLTGSVSAA
jgi:hypothetical protein